MDSPRPLAPQTSEPAEALAQMEQRLAHIFRHAHVPGQAPHPLLRLVRLYRAAQVPQEPPHG